MPLPAATAAVRDRAPHASPSPTTALPARRPLARALLAALLCAPGATLAQAPAATDADAGTAAASEPTTLDTVTVVGSRTERARADLPMVVDVIDRERMDRELARNLRDLFRYEPGLSVRADPARFGIGDIRLRGLQGNRVRLEVDGIALPDAFAIGSFSNAGRASVDPALLQRAEVVYGPASALYGSDALGGVVAFTTRDPADLVAPGESLHVGARMGWSSENDGTVVGSTLGGVGERWSALLSVSKRQGHETTPSGGDLAVDGPARTAANPQDTEGHSALAKLVREDGDGRRLRLTLEQVDDRADTDVRTAVRATTTGATTVDTTSLRGVDRQRRDRVALRWEDEDAGLAWLDRWQVDAWWQRSQTRQDTTELRSTRTGAAAAVPTRRERVFTFDQAERGLEAIGHHDFATGGITHTLTVGVEAVRTDIEQLRDGRQVNLLTGATSTVIAPDAFPVRDFPRSRQRELALFVQDELVLADGRLHLVPGLRVDDYRLDPREDAVFAADNPGVAPVALRERAVSPKLGAVWHLDDALSVFGGYARGFRAPPYDDVNIGFTNLAFGYTAIANPDLRPETSDGLELGLRRRGEALEWQVSAYENRYDDFIESLRALGVDPASGLLVFQSQNIDRARIRGLELRAGWYLGASAAALDGWRLRAAAAWAHGDDLGAGVPLASVDPARLTLGVGYEAERWGAELVGRGARRKDRLPDAGAFAAPGSGVVHGRAWRELAPGLVLEAGVFNLGDRTWWDWADTTGLAATTAGLGRYSRPGRELSLNLRVAF